MLRVDGLGVRFGGQAALAGVSFAVELGQVLLIGGPSGCGKSTLARCLNGLIPHSSQATMTGRVLIDGLDTREHPVWRLAAHVGLVLQHPETQLFNLTVEEEVAFGPRNLGLPGEEVGRRVEGALAILGLASLRRRPPPTLSAGEKQRLAIAAALALEPGLLVLDEALANLDVAARRALAETLVRLARVQGVAAVLLDHKISELTDLASQLLLLENGRMAGGGPPAAVLSQQGLLERLGLHRAAPPGSWRELLAGPWLSPGNGGGGAPGETGPPLLELCGVVAGYGHERVLHGVDLAVTRGEMLALVGDNGAGKSTLARVIAGLLPARGGEIRFAGARRRPRPGREVALLLESPDEQLFCDTLEDEVRFGAENLGLCDPERVEQVLQATRLAHLRARLPHALSLGQRQRTALAALLALGPQLLILDEPTLGQDWGHLGLFMDFIRGLNASGTTVLIITHDPELVRRYARRVVLLEEGRIVADAVWRRGGDDGQAGAASREGRPSPHRAIDAKGATS
jgi:energy-coupling factor transport system ATP-binding protein